jgi:protein TonB
MQVALLEPVREVLPPVTAPRAPKLERFPVEIPVLADIRVPEPATSQAITVETSGDPAPARTDAPRDEPLFVTEVEYVREPHPQYPPPSRRIGEEGLVVLRALIDTRGTATRVDVHESSGHARLDEAARLAVLSASFRPYLRNGVAHAVVVLIPIEFALGRHSPQRQVRTESAGSSLLSANARAD